MTAPLISRPDTAPLASEPTPEGEQTLVPGIRPISARERIEARMTAPLRPRVSQKPLMSACSTRTRATSSTCSDRRPAMILIPDDIRQRLLVNGAAERETDHVPVVKLFDPSGAATWLITEMMPDEPDILFGLCDLGFGCPELGYVSLTEIESAKGPLGLGIERDLHFVGRFPLSVYAEAARVAGRITESERVLAQAAAALRARHSELPPDAAGPTRR